MEKLLSFSPTRPITPVCPHPNDNSIWSLDHLLVFHGEGDIQDFPGNYTQYRDYQKLKSKEEDDRRQEEKKPKR